MHQVPFLVAQLVQKHHVNRTVSNVPPSKCFREKNERKHFYSHRGTDALVPDKQTPSESSCSHPHPSATRLHCQLEQQAKVGSFASSAL